MVWSTTVDAIFPGAAPESKLMFRHDGGSVAVLHQVILENDNHANDLIHDKGVPELASR